MPLILQLFGFLLCAMLIIYGGSRLSRYGDIIAKLTGMGKAWFGLILMAAVTSLPELFTGFSSIVLVDSPNIAVGDIMGSCAFNLMILVVLDYLTPKQSLFYLVTKGHLMAGFFGIFLITHVVASILFSEYFPVVSTVSASSLIIILLYLIATRMMFNYEKKQAAERAASVQTSERNDTITLRKAIRKFILFALLVVAGGVFLPFFADQLATEFGLSKTAVGTLLVAATTSLPELAVSISAVRIKSLDIAVGNLFGSNIFNMIILSIDDFLYRKGPLLHMVDPVHALTGLVTVLMTCVACISILYGQVRKRFALGLDALILLALYLSLIVAMF